MYRHSEDGIWFRDRQSRSARSAKSCAASIAQTTTNEAAKSPWGASDEIGALNMTTDGSRFTLIETAKGQLFARVDVFDDVDPS